MYYASFNRLDICNKGTNRGIRCQSLNIGNELISTRMLNGLELSDKRVPEDFWVNHVSSSFVGMVQWWIKNDLKQTPEELSEYFMAVISPSIVSESAFGASLRPPP